MGRIHCLLLCLLAQPVAYGQSPIDEVYQTLLGTPAVKSALARIEADKAITLREQIEISEIPAPSFHESVRARDYLRRLSGLGLANAFIDAEGNVVALRPGTGTGPTLVLAAHLDTVFPEGTDVRVREANDRYQGPGLGDDSRGLAVLLSVARTLKEAGIRSVGDILFVGTVGEEGLGNLRGVKALFRDHREIDGFISVDSIDAPEGAGYNRIFVQATGSRRWLVKFHGPGGHSFEEFGYPSAIHALGRAMARIADLKPPSDPKTTFTVGLISGGTAINAIAAEAQMQIDIRSNDAQALIELEKEIMTACDDAKAAENSRWNSTSAIRVERTLLGERPAGAIGKDTPIARAVIGAAVALNMPMPRLVAASSDSNIPLGLGIPAATVNGGGEGGKFHSLDEWYKPVNEWLGPQSVLLAALALVGVRETSEPLLPDRGP